MKSVEVSCFGTACTRHSRAALLYIKAMSATCFGRLASRVRSTLIRDRCLIIIIIAINIFVILIVIIILLRT